ncbi:hypothetical protein [Nocardia transvalensis]|uniref:hypothetical protein n=1 Tax=Nocardia transvalensis TaxID=37333 RepID=UPI001892D7CB|nr:hypothetical protein [Nocardia transvalensis]MBF6333470.1 hypothetical protein [Nocardia transvalensis]
MTDSNDDPAPSTIVSRWADLPTPDHAAEWEKVKVGTIDRILDSIEADKSHDRQMDWVDAIIRVVGAFSGIGTVAILAWISKYCVDAGAATAGAGIFGAGAASIVTAFITNARKQK